MRGKDQIDLDTDPPPDLALEIDVTHSSLNRLGIYAALRVPEVWRFDGQVVHVHLLAPDGTYAESPSSRAFPFLPIAELGHFMSLRGVQGNAALIRGFRTWVREQIARGWK
jgi:hypothetical protein